MCNLGGINALLSFIIDVVHDHYKRPYCRSDPASVSIGTLICGNVVEPLTYLYYSSQIILILTWTTLFCIIIAGIQI